MDISGELICRYFAQKKPSSLKKELRITGLLSEYRRVRACIDNYYRQLSFASAGVPKSPVEYEDVDTHHEEPEVAWL